MANDLRLLALSELDPTPGEDRVPVPGNVVKLRKEVLARMHAAGDSPRATGQHTQIVLDRVMFDSGKCFYEIKGDGARRLWIQKKKFDTVLDKQAAVLATSSLWGRLFAPLWVSLAWELIFSAHAFPKITISKSIHK